MSKIVLPYIYIFFNVCFSSEDPSFFSENGQDAYVFEKFFRDKREGFFVDIGAHAGIKNSNTYFFEKYLGWNGICFEPHPELFHLLKKNRKSACFNCAVTPKDGIYSFIKHEVSWVSGLTDFYNKAHYEKWAVEESLKYGKSEIINVTGVDLNNLLRKMAIKKVDLLSIDTEGSELAILKSIDFEEIFFNVIIVENIYHDPDYEEFLEKKGFILKERIHRDQVFISNR
jgi:FkbM family methyltransferase